jgi:hypothetical protein
MKDFEEMKKSQCKVTLEYKDLFPIITISSFIFKIILLTYNSCTGGYMVIFTYVLIYLN